MEQRSGESTLAEPGVEPAANPGRAWVGWLVVALVLAAVAALAWFSGGLRKAPPRLGDAIPAGQHVDTTLWRVRVDSAEVTGLSVSGSTLDNPVVRVHGRMTNLDDTSLASVTTDTLILRDPATGKILDNMVCHNDRQGDFGPLIEERVSCDFELTGDDPELIPPPAPGQTLALQVIVLDQTQGDGLDNVQRYVGTEPAGYVELEVRRR